MGQEGVCAIFDDFVDGSVRLLRGSRPSAAPLACCSLSELAATHEMRRLGQAARHRLCDRRAAFDRALGRMAV
jgi:hypothetical protein